MHTDYYSLLGVSRSASPEELKLAYRRLVQRLHPDVSAEPGAEERFKEVTHAYQVLRDPDSRVRYEIEALERELEVREQELNSEPPAPEVSLKRSRERLERDEPQTHKPRGFFKRFMRSREERESAESAPGDDYEVVAEIALEEAVRGGFVTLNFAVPERGANGGAREPDRTVEIRVPKLALAGHRVLLRGQGAPGAHGGQPGNLYVEIAYKRHWLFRVRDEHEVWFYLPIAPWEAVLGAIIEIPTLEKPFRVHVPAGATSGQTFRLPGRGLPRPDGGRGDLLACLRVITPEVPTEQERQLYLQLARASRFNPRRGFG
jgi:curved DNA-binding protein